MNDEDGIIHTVVYLVVSKPGGVDGKDHTDKGGVIKYASVYRADAEKRKGHWDDVKPTLVDMIEAKAKALMKLNALDILALGIREDKIEQCPGTN